MAHNNAFADVTGDGRADALVTNNNTVTVRPTEVYFSFPFVQLYDFAPNEDWTHGPYYGITFHPNPFDPSSGVGSISPPYFADVTGDGKADAIVINNSAVNGTSTFTVRPSDGNQFPDYSQSNWLTASLVGSHGNYFADVNNDGKADAIAVGDDTVKVYLSDGKRFLPTGQDWTHGAFYGTKGTYLADANGDGRDDIIAVNENTITVRPSDGMQFLPNEDWTHGAFYGDVTTEFADVNGDGKADAIAVNRSTVTVRLSDADPAKLAGSGQFSDRPGFIDDWTHGAYYGDLGIVFADVTGDGKADAIVSNTGGTGVTVRPSDGSQFLPNQDWSHGPYYGTLPDTV